MIEDVFELLLARLDEQGRDEDEDGWDDEVADRLEALRDAYDNLTVQDRDEIEYDDLATQAAYVFAYAIGRAEFTYQLLVRHRAKLGRPLFKNPAARITSLGGGPGSEIAGIVKYLLDPQNGENVTSIKYWVFDKDAAWEDTCQALVESLGQYIPVELVFDNLDLCDQKACRKISLEGDDLLILSFVISELCALKNRDDAEESLRSLFKTIDNGSIIFYNDSNASSFYYFFNATRKYVKGMGKVSEVSEIIDNVEMRLAFGPTYLEYSEQFDATPHLTSNALSKLIVRTIQ